MLIQAIPSLEAAAHFGMLRKSRFAPKIGFRYKVLAHDPAGQLLWSRDAENLITTAGAEQLLKNTFPTSETAITSWFVGVIAATAGQQTTGAMTSGSTTLTLGVAFGTTPAVGQVVTVFGAGASGGNLVTTFASGAGTSWVLAAAAGTTVSAAACVCGPVLADADTSALHAGWVEASTSQVTQTVRAAYSPAAVSTSGVNAAKTNAAAPAAYTGNTPNWYLTGLFLASSSAIASITDILLSEAAFDANATPAGAALVQSGTALSITAVMQMNAG